MKDSKLYLLPKIHKRLHQVPGKAVISFPLDNHFELIAPAVKCYIKNTSNFLKKLRSLQKLTDDIILCIMDVAKLYLNQPHDESLSVLR